MSLKEYKKKRDFTQTKEPPAKLVPKSKKQLAFVVQKHAATHLHYDFRLESEGVLKSWVLPKGPSLDPKDKRLAIMVEDHPYEYRKFEGTIPKGNYGAGTVMIWDEGTYTPLEKSMPEAIKKGHIIFEMKGKKLKGVFHLVKLKQSNQWLFFKGSDEHASNKDVTRLDKSAVTKRSMQQIGKKTKMPHKIKPMLASLIDKPFDSPDWIFEIKWDGYRAIGEADGKKVQLYSRTFQSFNKIFHPIVEALETLDTQAIFDGEVVVLDKKGKSDFQSLQNYQKTGKGDIRYYIFDVLYFNGRDLRSLPLIERKVQLRTILPKDPRSLLQYSDHIDGQGKKFYAAALKKGLEGIMAKEKQSPYESKRTKKWLKIKTHKRQEAIICGFTQPKGSRQKFGALVLGVYKRGTLIYVGLVGGGFDTQMLNDIKRKLDPLIIKKSPFPKPLTLKNVTWVKPKYLCEVSFAEWTQEGQMRQPIFKGLRTDKNPKEVKHEVPI